MKLGKKILSLIICLCMVSGLFCMAFTVSAENVSYTVSCLNPAIPMRAQTTVDLSSLEVYLTEEISASGADINWSTDDSSVELDNNAKTLKIYAEGAYELYASYNGIAKTIVAVVVPADAVGDANGIYEAKIFEYDFTNGTWDDFKKDWSLQTKPSNVSSFKEPATPVVSSKTYSQSGFVPFVASYIDENGETVQNTVYFNEGTMNLGYMYLKKGNVVENFSDYNVYSTGILGQIARSGPTSSSGSGTSRAGVLGRVVLNKDGALDYKSNYQAALTSVVNYSYYKIDDQFAHYNAYMTRQACMVWTYNNEVDSDSYYGTNVKDIDVGTTFTVYGKYNGNSITTGIIKGDLASATAENTAERTITSANYTYDPKTKLNYVAGENGLGVEQCGTVGLVYNGIETNLQSFTVTHNVDLNNLPEVIDEVPIEYFAVDSELPYFVMRENTSISLNNLIVPIGENSFVGSQVQWSAEAGIALDTANGILTAGNSGSYTLTVTNGGIANEIYVYVIGATDTKVNIIDYDFTKGSWEDWSKDWGIQTAVRNSQSDIVWSEPFTELVNSSYDYAANNIKGIVPVVTEYLDESGNPVKVNVHSKSAQGIMYSKNPLIAKMSDYTITANAYVYDRGYNAQTSDNRSASGGSAGLVGRIELVDGRITLNSRYQGHPISWVQSSSRVNFTATLANGSPTSADELVTEKGFNAYLISKGTYSNSINPGQFSIADGVAGNLSDTSIQKQYVTYQTVFSGNSATVGFGLDNSIDTDTGTITDKAYRLGSNGYTIYSYSDANELGNQYNGTVGFMYFGVEEAIQCFKATIDLDAARIPATVSAPTIEYTEIGLDNDIRTAPNTSIDLSLLSVAFNDTLIVTGDTVSWNCSDSAVEINGNVLTVTDAGGYKLTATADNVIREINLFVVDNNATVATLADYNFTNEEVKNSWSNNFGRNFSTSGKANLAVENTLPTTDYTGTTGLVPFTYLIDGTKYGAQGDTGNGVYGILYLKNDFISTLSNYTVTATFNAGSPLSAAPYSTDGNSSPMSGFGFATNITVDSTGVVTDYLKLNVHSNWSGNVTVTALSAAHGTVKEEASATTDWGNSKVSQYNSLSATISGNSVTATLAGTETISFNSDFALTNGTVGMLYAGRDFDLHTFTVTYPLTNSVLAPIAEVTDNKSVDSINIGVGEVADLTQIAVNFKGTIVLGSNIEWSADDNTSFEVSESKLYAFEAGSFSIAAQYDGSEKQITVNIDNQYAGTSLFAQAIIPDTDNGDVVITKNNYGEYSLSVTADNGYTLKAGSLKVTIGENEIHVITRNNTAGTSFVFAAQSIGGAVIGAEFEPISTANASMLGGTIRLESAKYSAGLRFGARLNNVKTSGEKVVLDTTITVDGNTYTATGVGSLLIPSVILGDDELTVDTPYVEDNPVKVVADSTVNYSDAFLTMTGMPTQMQDYMISARMYISYLDENGETQYYYTNTIERSYNGVYESVYPTVNDNTEIDKLITVKAEKNNDLGENLAVGVAVRGRYTAQYSLLDTDGTQISNSVISSVNAYKAYSQIVFLPDKTGEYKLTVTVKDADIVGRNEKTDLVKTYTLSVADGDIIVTDTQKYLNEQHYEYGNKKGEDSTYLKFTIMSDQHYSWGSYGDGNNTYMNTRKNFAASLNATDTEFVFMAGDNVDWALAYRSNIETNNNFYVLHEALSGLKDKDVYAIYGNHDTDTEDFKDRQVIDAGNITIISYSSAYVALSADSGEVRSTTSLTDELIEWLKSQCEAALVRNPDTHLVFINHYGVQNDENFEWPMLYDGDADLAAQELESLNRNKLLDVITQYGVELYINGHEHNNNMNYSEIKYENGLGTGCINYNAGNEPTDCIIEEYENELGEKKIKVTMNRYTIADFTEVKSDMSAMVTATKTFDLIGNGKTAQETLDSANEYYVADTALRTKYSGKYNDIYNYSFEFAGVQDVNGTNCYTFNVSRLLYYVVDSTVTYDEKVEDKTGILREALATVYITADGSIVDPNSFVFDENGNIIDWNDYNWSEKLEGLV